MNKSCSGCGRLGIYNFSDRNNNMKIALCQTCYDRLDETEKKRLRNVEDPNDKNRREMDFISIGVNGVHYFMLSPEEKRDLLEKIKSYHTSSSHREVGRDNQKSVLFKRDETPVQRKERPTSASLPTKRSMLPLSLCFFVLGVFLTLMLFFPPPYFLALQFVIYLFVCLLCFVAGSYLLVKK